MRKKVNSQKHLKPPEIEKRMDQGKFVRDVRRDWYDKGILVSTSIMAIFTVIAAAYTKGIYESAVDTAKKQLQAYVGIESIELSSPAFKLPNCQPPTLHVGINYSMDTVNLKVKNYGQTAAHAVESHTNWYPMPFGQQLDIKFDYPDRDSLRSQSSAVVVMTSSDIIYPQSAIIQKTYISKQSEIENAQNNKIYLYFYGHVDYTDIYNQRWRQNFAYLYLPNKNENQFFRLSRHNELIHITDSSCN